MSGDFYGPKNSYVYTLATPDEIIFYVGQGKGNRILAHEREARCGVQSPKCDIIRQIWANGGKVIRTKVQENLTSYDAIKLESKLIMKYEPAGNKLTRDKPKVSVPIPSVRGDLARRFRQCASAKAGYQLSEQELIELAQSLAYQAIDTYCENAMIAKDGAIIL